jgi:hypothetical protein
MNSDININLSILMWTHHICNATEAEFTFFHNLYRGKSQKNEIAESCLPGDGDGIGTIFRRKNIQSEVKGLTTELVHKHITKFVILVLFHILIVVFFKTSRTLLLYDSILHILSTYLL